MSPDEWRESQRRQNTESGNNRQAWIRTATRLLLSASILHDCYNDGLRIMLRAVLSGGPSADVRTSEEEHSIAKENQVRSVSLMLVGFAIEALMKATYLHGGNLLYENGHLKRLAKKGRVHNLRELADAYGLTSLFNDEEQELLDQVSAENERGRYPAFSRPDTYGASFPEDNEIKKHYMSWSIGSEATLHTCITKLFLALDEPCPDDADSLLETWRIVRRSYNQDPTWPRVMAES